MLIGIDASRAVTAQATGTEIYSQRLIRALIDLAPDHRFRLYFNHPPADNLFRSGNVENKTIPFRRLWTHIRLSLEVTRRPPDVLFVPSHVLPVLHPRRSVVTVHDLGYLHFPDAYPTTQRLYLDASTRWNARASARVIADSQATKDDLTRRYHTPADKIVVAYPGLDPAIRRVQDPQHIQAVKARHGIKGEYLLYLGTLQPRKNLSRLIEAFGKSSDDSLALVAQRSGVSRRQQAATDSTGALRRVATTHPLKLVIVGKKGWLYADLFRQVAQLGLADRVMFPGYLSDADKAALISGATALVFPSLYEGFGFPVIEAMACGTPVICSSTSSMPEAAGDAALLVDPLDTNAIATAIDRILSDIDLRRDLAERGVTQAAKFTWQACARTVLNVLEDVTRR
ncbi:MAG: glycosyltransferase family 4 protein [Anaerolineae bacterium]